MTLRMIDSEAQLSEAFEALETALGGWSGGQSDAWRREEAQGVVEGVSFARRDDVYVFLERRPDAFVVGVALSESDADLVAFSFGRSEPAGARRRQAAAINDAGETFLLLGIDELKRQGVHDVFRRLAGAVGVKRAHIAERDYVLLGPLGEPESADALLSVAELHPRFERHVERLGALAARSDSAEGARLYPVSARVVRQHRVFPKIAAALFERFAGAGYQLDAASAGPVQADLALRRGEDTLVFEIRPDCTVEDIQRGLGQLVLLAPNAEGVTRLLVLPAGREPEAAATALAVFRGAFDELAVVALTYDFRRPHGAVCSFVGVSGAARGRRRSAWLA